MKRNRRKAKLRVCLVVCSFAILAAGWGHHCLAAAKDEKPSAMTVAQAIRQKVKEMDYDDDVAVELVKMAAALKCDELKQTLERVRLDNKRKKSSLTQLLTAEDTISKALFYYIYEKLPYDFELKYNSLDYVAKDHRARCYGFAQLYYVLGSAIGLAVDIVGAEPDGNSLTPGGHACNLVRLSNGKVIMVGMALPTAVVSKPFMFKAEFAEDGNYWVQKNRGNHLKVHSKIQLRDKDAIRAAIYFNRSAEDQSTSDAAALGFLSKAIELDPKYAEVVLTRGMRYLRMKENKKALADFDKTVQIDPASSDAYCYRGAAHAELGESGKALEDLSKAIELDDKNAEAYRQRGRIHDKLGQRKEAAADFTSAIACAFHKRARAFHESLRYDTAVKNYSSVLELAPSRSGVYCQRGEAYLALANYTKAIADFDKAIQADPKSAAAHLGRGCACLKTNEFKQAVADLSKTIELDSKIADAYFLRSKAYKELGKNKDSADDLAKAHKLDPYLDDADTKETVEPGTMKLFDHVIAASTGEIMASYNNRAIMYAKWGQPADAIADYTKSIEIEPDDPIAYYNRALDELRLGKTEQAKKDLQKAGELRPALRNDIQAISDHYKLGL
jgi:tetratricopeptide (TPR) repeat protein